MVRARLVRQHPERAEQLLTAGQIERHMHWDEALSTAELEPRPRVEERNAVSRSLAMSAGKAYALFVRHHGKWPTLQVLATYFRQAGLALPRVQDVGVPAAMPRPRSSSPGRTSQSPVRTRHQRPRRAVRRTTARRGHAQPQRTPRRPRAVRARPDDLAEQLERRDAHGQRAYRAFSVGKPDCPPPASFNRNGLPGIEALRAEAERRLAAGETPWTTGITDAGKSFTSTAGGGTIGRCPHGRSPASPRCERSF